MAPPAAIVVQVRRSLDDATARKWSNNDILYDINEGGQYLQNLLKVLKCRRSLSSVANQREYALPTDMKEILEMEFYDEGSIHKVQGMNYDTYREYKAQRTGSIPYIYSVIPNESKILIEPVCNSAADTTTLGADLTAVATSMTVASNASFYDEGRVIIDSEVIGYTGKTSTTTLTGLTRGLEGTTAATHSSAATVTERDIMLYGVYGLSDFEMRKYYTTGTGSVTFTYGSVTVTGTSVTWSNNVAAGDYIAYTTNATQVVPTKWYAISSVPDTSTLVLTSAYAESTTASSNYIVSSPNPFPNEYDALLRTYARARALEKSNSMKEADREWAIFGSQVSAIKNRLTSSDVLIVQRGRYEGRIRDSQRFRANLGDKYPIV